MENLMISQAFKEYLLSITRDAAIQHVYECLTEGADNNEAWTLMELTHGKAWACMPDKLHWYINDAIANLVAPE